MMQYACKCLNVVIKCDAVHAETVDLEKFGLTSAEQRDPFFREQLCSFSKADVQLAQESLVERQSPKGSDNWHIYSCLNCQVQTHAASVGGLASKFLIKFSFAVTPQALANVTKNDKYSSVFKILVEEKDDQKRNSVPIIQADKMHSAVGDLSRQLTKALQSQLESVEEEIRIFRDKKYAEFECFREKAHKDHKILTSIATASSQSRDEALSWSPMEVTPHSPLSSAPLVSLPPQSRGRLSSFKGPIKLKPIIRPSASVVGAKEDSLDSEGIFDLEGMDLETPPHNGGNSDMYFSDSDDSASRDEGIHIARGSVNHKNDSGANKASILAKSLPMNMPVFPNGHEVSHEVYDDNEEPADIAASIKALAKSVHEDVFGDLPRPRFSTLI